MTLVEIRDAIVSRALNGYAAAFPDIPMVTENAPFDYNNPPDTFAELEIEFHDGKQLNVAVDPKTRYHGCVYLTVTTREGKGTRAALALLDWGAGQLGYYRTLRLHLQAPEPHETQHPRGWYSKALKVDFYADPA